MKKYIRITAAFLCNLLKKFFQAFSGPTGHSMPFRAGGGNTWPMDNIRPTEAIIILALA
jgi:hypothetical protein